MGESHSIEREAPEDAVAVEHLIEQAFGPGRFTRAVERLRETAADPLPCSMVVRGEAGVIGCSRMWAVEIGETPAVLLGPFAVNDLQRNRGLGQALAEAACQAAAADGHKLVVLVGDEPFFGRVGFSAAPKGSVRLPGPVDPARVLLRELAPGAGEGVSGMLKSV